MESRSKDQTSPDDHVAAAAVVEFELLVAVVGFARNTTLPIGIGRGHGDDSGARVQCFDRWCCCCSLVLVLIAFGIAADSDDNIDFAAVVVVVEYDYDAKIAVG